jgi:type 1 fimbria pilin
MKFNENRVTVIFLMIMFVLCIGVASAETLHHGKVSLRGYIIDAPCNIDTPDHQQAISYQDYNESVFFKSKNTEKYPFTLLLTNCILALEHNGVSDKTLYLNVVSKVGISLQDEVNLNALHNEKFFKKNNGKIKEGEDASPQLIFSSRDGDVSFNFDSNKNVLIDQQLKYNSIILFKMNYF